MTRAYNFSAGPATLPETVLEQAGAELLDWHGAGASIVELSHRGPEFMQVASEAEADLRTLLSVPDDIIDLVCRAVAAALVAYRSEDGGTGLAADKEITSERLGDWSVTYGADGRVTEMELTQAWRDRLAARFGNSITALMSR